MTDDSAEILFQSFLRDAIVSSSGTDRDVHSLTLAFPLPTTPSAAFQSAMKGDLGETVVARDMFEPGEFRLQQRQNNISRLETN